MQLARFSGAALREVGVGLRRDPGRHRGQRHQLGVRRLLAAEHDDRLARQQDGVEPSSQTRRPPRSADDDEVGAVEQGRQVVGEPGRVGRGASRRRRRGRDSRSVSEVDSSRITGTAPGAARGAWRTFLGVRAPGRRRRRGSVLAPATGTMHSAHGGGTAPDSHRLPRLPLSAMWTVDRCRTLPGVAVKP